MYVYKKVVILVNEALRVSSSNSSKHRLWALENAILIFQFLQAWRNQFSNKLLWKPKDVPRQSKDNLQKVARAYKSI